ncbi:MAG TPA: tetratricopeptide repeat protein [Pyrinomonadaceae bacterium]|jgi:tetratricopeptide (TPR) repeat protein
MKQFVFVVLLVLVTAQLGCWRRTAVNSSNSESAAQGVAVDSATEARVLLERGKEFYRDDRDDKAVESFQQALKLDPDLAEAHFRLGLTYDAMGMEQESDDSYKKAVESYKKFFANEENDSNAEAHYNLAQSYFGLNLYAEAVREYRAAVRFKEDDADIYYDLGLALSRLAQYDEAAAAFEKSLELDPENYRAEDELAEAREGIKRIRAGRKHQEDLAKKKKEEELKKQQETGTGESSNKPVSTRTP